MGTVKRETLPNEISIIGKSPILTESVPAKTDAAPLGNLFITRMTDFPKSIKENTAR